MTSRPRIYIPDPQYVADRTVMAFHRKHTRFKNFCKGFVTCAAALGWLWFVYVVFLVDTTLPGM